jgi:uncharacterized protein YjbI with pentapeptide repeats
MANAEQLALLKAGVEGWNERQKQGSDTQIDLSGANFSEANLSGAVLCGNLQLNH